MVQDPDRSRAVMADQLDRLSSGELTAALDRTFPHSQAADAYRRVASREAFGHIIIKP